MKLRGTEAVPTPANLSREAQSALAQDLVSARRSGVALRILDRLAETLVVAALFLELGLVLANVLARLWFGRSFLWADEAARMALSILAFVGGAVAYRRREHAHVRLILGLLPPRGEAACLALADVIVLFAAGLTGVVSIGFIASNWSERTPILQLPASLIAMPLPLGMALILIFAADRLWRTHGRTALPTAASFVLAAGAAAATCGEWLPLFGDDAPIIAALILFVVAILAGVPVDSSCCSPRPRTSGAAGPPRSRCCRRTW